MCSSDLLYYFSELWKQKDKILRGAELEMLTHGSFQIYVEAMIIFEAFGDINPGVHHNDRMCYL